MIPSHQRDVRRHAKGEPRDSFVKKGVVGYGFAFNLNLAVAGLFFTKPDRLIIVPSAPVVIHHAHRYCFSLGLSVFSVYQMTLE